MPTPTSRLGLQQPETTDSVTEYRQSIGANASTLDVAALDTQGTLASRPATPTPNVTGSYYWATDTAQLFRWNGSAWSQIYPSADTMVHSWTMDDHTGPNPAATVLGSWFVPANGETLIGAIIHCVSQGATPSTFQIETDHGNQGTLSAVTGLTGLEPTTTQQLVSISPFSLSALDRVSVACTNASTGTSVGVTVATLSLPS